MSAIQSSLIVLAILVIVAAVVAILVYRWLITRNGLAERKKEIGLGMLLFMVVTLVMGGTPLMFSLAEVYAGGTLGELANVEKNIETTTGLHIIPSNTDTIKIKDTLTDTTIESDIKDSISDNLNEVEDTVTYTTDGDSINSLSNTNTIGKRYRGLVKGFKEDALKEVRKYIVVISLKVLVQILLIPILASLCLIVFIIFCLSTPDKLRKKTPVRDHIFSYNDNIVAELNKID